MRYIGFIKEQDKNILASKKFEEMFVKNENASDLIEKITCYLENGIFVTGVMSYIYDNENKPIGGLSYFTDGKFIWPVYYAYYLKKYKNFYLDPDFVQHVKNNNFRINHIEQEVLKEIERRFFKEWSGKSE